MTDFYNSVEYRKARKEHSCTYCGESIPSGSSYAWQSGNYEGRWFTSKMHLECFEDMCENGDGEYTPYSNERPKEKHETQDDSAA